MVRTTRLQREALKRVYCRIVREAQQGQWPEGDAAANYFGLPGLKPVPKPITYRAFRATVQTLGTQCIMVPFAGMWLGIEPDGHTHS